MIHIRDTEERDIDAICALLEQLGYQQEVPKFRARFAKFLSVDGYGAVVAELGEEVAGFIAWTKTMLLVSDRTRIRIEAMIVDEKLRGKGVGKALLSHVEDIATKLSPAILELTSGKRREVDGAHDFYDSLGYKNSGLKEKVYLRKEF